MAVVPVPRVVVDLVVTVVAVVDLVEVVAALVVAVGLTHLTQAPPRVHPTAFSVLLDSQKVHSLL